MFIIVGNTHFTHNRKRTREVINCPNCAHQFNFLLSTTSSWFTVLFVPVFPYRFKRNLECPHCGCRLKVSGPDYDMLLKNGYKDRIRRI